MPNGLIYNDTFADVASLAANTENPIYPAVNLKTDAPAKVYRSLNAYIQIDAAYAAPVTCKAFAIVNHNFPINSPALAVRCSNDSNFSTYTQYTFTYNPETIIYIVQTPLPFQYYRFIFNLGSGDYIGSIGQIKMGSWIEFPNRLVNPVQITPVEKSLVIISESGQKTIETISTVWQYTLPLKSVKYSDYIAIVKAFSGKRAKVLVLNAESGLIAVQGQKTDNLSASGENGFYDFTLKFETNPYQVS